MAKRDHRYLALSYSQHDAHGGRRFGANTNTNAYSDPNSVSDSNANASEHYSDEPQRRGDVD
jgi:hypothetical protein